MRGHLSLILSPRGGEGRAGRAGLLDEFVEEGVFAVVRGPDGEIAGPGDAGLSGLPESLALGCLANSSSPTSPP